MKSANMLLIWGVLQINRKKMPESVDMLCVL